uniref:Uncharacterized protein n=1 Tax=Rhizophora mucronata TaxID=61149 RepID=A0A2P2PD03_RHIMU
MHHILGQDLLPLMAGISQTQIGKEFIYYLTGQLLDGQDCCSSRLQLTM